MRAQKVANQLKLREWSRQIVECESSGKSISEWCSENGVGYKNYFYRKRRVREELLESGTALSLSMSSLEEAETAVFAQVSATSVMHDGSVAVLVQIGKYTAEIMGGADAATVEGVLRTLSQL